jgi:hypothetical protein
MKYEKSTTNISFHQRHFSNSNKKKYTLITQSNFLNMDKNLIKEFIIKDRGE